MTNEQRITALELMNTMSWRKIAKHLGLPKSTVSDYLRDAKVNSKSEAKDGPKVLFFDVETSPSVTLAFSRFKAFASPSHVLQEPYLLMFGYAWGNGEVKIDKLNDFEVDHSSDDRLLVERMWELFDEADIVVAHNSNYDKGWANQQFVKYDLPPPSNYQVVCTLKAAKKAFSLPSNSLAASAQYFNLTRKLSHEGISLWKRCMEMEDEAFDEMAEYCAGDIVTLQELYHKILPYMPTHPNHALYYEDSKRRCKMCGSENINLTGKYHHTTVSKFATWQCGDCGGISRERKSVVTMKTKPNLMA